MSEIAAGGNSIASPSTILQPSGAAPAYTPKLDFSDKRNSQYIALLWLLGFI